MKILNITVSGHSAGGNHAQYVTITYKDYMGDNYEAINDIDKCVSFDSQGFSFEFLKKYSQAIENRADKITSYCPTEATVGGCMSSIPGIEEKFIDIGFPNAFPIGYHMPAEMLNEKGEFKQEGEPSLKYTLLKKATTCTLAITEKLPGIDVEKTLVEVGEFIDAVVNKGDVLGEGKDLIFSKDSIIVLGILLKELEPLVDLNKATLGITVAGATINEIDNCIEEIGDFVESGDIIQAIDRADETFCKLRLGLQLYQGGMLTGNQVIAAANFIIGWNAGKLENKVRTTIRDKVCEATVYVCKEIYEAGETAYEVGKKAGKYVKKKLNKLWDNVCDALGICDDDYKSASSVQRYIPDPLVIDLDFDGFELKNVEDGVYFDNDNKGHLEKTQWVSSDDGLLALDLNMDGLINDGSELFGTSTVMPDRTLAKSGFEALSQYDDNNDGVIDEEDKVYEKLLVWQDKNSNGISEADELKTLKDMGIKSISLSAGTVDGVNSSMINYNDGTSGKIGEFSFDAQLYNVVEKESIEISEEIKELPDIDAIGNVASLHTLMQSDTTGILIEYVKNFASSTEPSGKEKIVTDILYFITGANEVSSGSRGGEFDAKKLKVIEEFMGRKFVGTNGANPVNSAAPILNNIYNNIFELYYNMLNGETALKDYLAMTYVGESESGNKYIDTTLFDTYMKICSEKGVDIKNTVKDMGRYILSINYGNKENFVKFVESYIGYQDIIDELSKISGTSFVIGTAEDDSIIGNGGSETIIAGNGNDSISGGTGNDYIAGGEGNDTVNAGDGNDTIYGESGNDILNGGNGNDVYIFGRSTGTDTIYDTSGTNTLKFEEGITIDDLVISTTGTYDITISLKEGDSQVVLNSYRYSNAYKNFNVMFDDNSVWKINPNTYSFELISGIDSRLDNIYDISLDDVNVSITDFGGEDIINLGEDVMNLIFEKDGDNLNISSSINGNTLTIYDWCVSENNRIESIVTADGYDITNKQLQQMVDTMAAFGDGSGIYSSIMDKEEIGYVSPSEQIWTSDEA